MKIASTHRLCGIALMALWLAACGRSETPSAAALANLTACALITKEEGAEALGEAVNEPEEQIISPGGDEMAAVSQCNVQATGTAGKVLSVFYRRSPVADNQPDLVRQTLTESGATVEDVSGVGDAALWGAGQLHVFVGDAQYLIVTVGGLPDGDARARTSQVAQRAIERLRS